MLYISYPGGIAGNAQVPFIASSLGAKVLCEKRECDDRCTYNAQYADYARCELGLVACVCVCAIVCVCGERERASVGKADGGMRYRESKRVKETQKHRDIERDKWTCMQTDRQTQTGKVLAVHQQA